MNGMAIRPAFIVIALLIVVMAVTGCVPATQSIQETAKDLRPFVSRSEAAARERIDRNTDSARLIALLAEGDTKQIVAAALGLGQKEDPEAVAPLTALLNHADASVRFAAGRALTQIGDPAIPELSRALNDKDEILASGAAEVLGGIGGQEAYDALSGPSANGSDEVRIQVLASQVSIDPERTLPLLMAEIENRDSTVRYAAAELAAEVGQPAVQPLEALLEGTDPDVVSLAADALGIIGNTASVRSLTNLLKRKRSDAIRMSAARALGRIGDPTAAEPLAELLTDEVSVVRQIAADALAAIGAAAVEPTIKAMSEDDPEIRDLASGALVRIGSPAVDALIPVLDNRNPETVWQALDTLGKIGDSTAIPAIAAQLTNANKDLAMAAVEALGAIGQVSAVDPLADALKSDPSRLGPAVTEALVKIGPPSADALCNLLGDDNRQVRQLAADALIRLDTSGMDTVVSWLGQTSGRHQEALALVLSAIGAPAVPLMAGVLPECEPAVQKSIVGALTRIGGEEALAALVSAMKNWNTRQVAAAGLRAMGWTPKISDESVVYQVATGQKSGLKASWDITRYVLSKELNAKGESSTNFGAFAFIALGDERIVPQLVSFMEKKGKENLAAIYWHSANAELTAAARKWFDTQGIKDPEMIMDSTLPKVTWGSMGENPVETAPPKAAE